MIKSVTSRMSKQIELVEVIYRFFISMIMQTQRDVKCLFSHASITHFCSLHVTVLSFKDSTSLIYIFCCREDVNVFLCAATAAVILYDFCMSPAGTLYERAGPVFHDDRSY